LDLSCSNSILRADESEPSDLMTLIFSSSLSDSSPSIETSALMWVKIRAKKIEKMTSFEAAMRCKCNHSEQNSERKRKSFLEFRCFSSRNYTYKISSCKWTRFFFFFFLWEWIFFSKKECCEVGRLILRGITRVGLDDDIWRLCDVCKMWLCGNFLSMMDINLNRFRWRLE
jgi:hypothetical protein